MSENAKAITTGILGNNVTDNSAVMQGLLAAYPYLTQGTNQHFYPNQMEAIGNQLFMGFGGPQNTPQQFQDRVQAPFTPFQGAPAAPQAAPAPAQNQQPEGNWAIPHPTLSSGQDRPSGPWLDNNSINQNTPGARFFPKA